MIDPKHFSGLKDNILPACRSYSRDDPLTFHLAFPDTGVRLDPMYSFTNDTEIALCICQAFPSYIETFGSPEAAQNALFHSASARRYFAQQLHQSMSQSDWNNKFPQPLSTIGIDTMARPHRESFETEKFNQFDQTRQANNLDYQISKQSSIGDKEVSDLPQTSVVTSSVNNFRESLDASKTQLQGKLLIERGTTLSAKAVYEEKQSGVPTVFANAYLGGALYSSPHEYKDQLTEKTNSESFRKAMQEIGKQDKAELSDVERSAQK